MHVTLDNLSCSFTHPLTTPTCQVLESVSPSLLHWSDPLKMRKELFRKPFASWPLNEPQAPTHAALHWKVRRMGCTGR